jgi:hypothetical protein
MVTVRSTWPIGGLVDRCDVSGGFEGCGWVTDG